MRKIIFTDHAYERMYLRNISRSLIQSAINQHDELKHEDDGDTQFIKNISRGGRRTRIHVVARPLPEEGQDTWLIKTTWIRGEDDPGLLVGMLRMLLMRIFHSKPRRR